MFSKEPQQAEEEATASASTGEILVTLPFRTVLHFMVTDVACLWLAVWPQFASAVLWRRSVVACCDWFWWAPSNMTSTLQPQPGGSDGG